MGMFSKKGSVEPVETELTETWFVDWANSVRSRMDEPFDLSWFLEKAIAVIDHDCRDYVAQHCDRSANAAYARYVDGSTVTPWGLVSLVAGLSTKPEWPDFIVTDVKNKVGRFGDIVVDPSIAG